jgi:acetyltransferase-like isoleucine patch superfamily enzyme
MIKSMLNGLAVVFMLPAILAYHFSALLLGREIVFPGWSQAVSLLPGLSGTYLRRAFYRFVLARCESGSVITFGTVFASPHAQVGTNTYIGAYGCLGDVNLEADVLIGSQVSITNGNKQHGIERLDIPVREQPGEWPKITIGQDTWVGDRAVIMANVGKHCVVGAGAVVTKPVPDYAIVAGVPARIIGHRGGETEAN